MWGDIWWGCWRIPWLFFFCNFNLKFWHFYYQIKFLIPVCIKSFKPPKSHTNPIGIETIPTGIRPENPHEIKGKMSQNSRFITSNLKKFLKVLRFEVMNPEFWNVFPVSSRGLSGRILVGIIPIPIGYKSK